MLTNPPSPQVLEVKQPHARIALLLENGQRIVANLEGGREFISCSVTWTSYGRERCRLRLSSHSQAEALNRTRGREWYCGEIGVGGFCEIEVDA